MNTQKIFNVNNDSGEKYRHEYKYICTEQQLTAIYERIKNILILDPHTNKSGRYKGIYNIRSLYFDDIDDTYYYANLNGTDPREKFRIRIYNHSADIIKLELKKKVHGKCRKLSCPITQEQCRTLMRGELLPDSSEYPPILQKLLLEMKTRLLKPVIIVEYDRTPFIYAAGNVRVTFDRNIASSKNIEQFLDDDIPLRPVTSNGIHLLEVKWDEFLPDFIYHSLMLGSLHWTAFSKFFLCRCYNAGAQIK